MARPLPIQMRGRVASIALNTGQPTITVPLARVGQVFTVNSLGTWDRTYIPANARIQWQQTNDPLFLNWVNIAGATGLSFTATSAQIDSRVRALVSVPTLDRYSMPVATLASAIIQDNPAQALQIVGTPLTTATIGRQATFSFAALGGRPATSGPKYSFAIIGTPPSGTSLQIDAEGDEGNCDLGTSTGGSWSNLRIRVTDSAGNTADLGPFSFEVVPEGQYQTPQPGLGWTGLTQIGTNFGSPTGVGYGFQPTIRIDTPPFVDIDQPYVVWIYARHSGDQAAFDALNPDVTKAIDPTYGMDNTNAIRVAFDNGAFVNILKQWNSSDKAFGYPVRIDPSLWADGVPSLTDVGQRMMRVIGRPKNGNEGILQGPVGDWLQAFRFSTNANGTLPRQTRYIKNSGSDAANGLAENTAKKTIEGALASIPSNQVNGAIIEICEAGNYDYSASSARTATTRYVTVRGKASLSQAAVVLNSQSGGSGIRCQLVRLKHLKHNQIITGIGATAHTVFEDVLADRGEGWAKVGDIDPYVRVGGSAAGKVYFLGGRVTNYSNAFRDAFIVRGTSVGKIGSDLFTNTLLAIGVVCDQILSGEIESSPGVGTGKTFHPDSCQYLRTPANDLTKNWTIGAILINVVVLDGDCQGPFFKDNQYISGIFLENFQLTMTNTTGRNSFRVCKSDAGSPFAYTTLQNSHFLDSSFYWGNGTRDIGICEDVIFGNCRYPGAYQPGGKVYRPVTGYRPPY